MQQSFTNHITVVTSINITEKGERKGKRYFGERKKSCLSPQLSTHISNIPVYLIFGVFASPHEKTPISSFPPEKPQETKQNPIDHANHRYLEGVVK
jgi:hypothetical protein